MNRLVIYLLFDRAGLADAGVLRALRGLRGHASELFVVVNGSVTDASRESLASVADRVFERPNEGFDVGGYRAALEEIGLERLAAFDEVVLANYTFFGPVVDFAETFAWADAAGHDVWGVTEHGELSPDPYTRRGTLPSHLQSHWIAVRRDVVVSDAWAEYWASMPEIRSYDDSVRHHEARFSPFFAERGFSVGAQFPAGNFRVDGTPVANASLETPLLLLEAGAPLVKRRVFFHDPVELDHRGVSARDVALDLERRGFPVDVLVEGTARFAPSRVLAGGVGAGPRVLRRASTALTHEWLRDAASGDESATISGLHVRIVRGDFWRRLAGGDERLLDADLLLVESAAADSVRSAPASASMLARQRGRRVIFERAEPLAWEFADHASLGMVVPVAPPIGTGLLGDGWRGTRTRAALLAATLGADAPLDPNAPIAPYAGFAAYRVDALRPLAGALGSLGYAPLEARFPEGELATLLDLVASRLVFDAGFAVSEAETADGLASDYALLAAKYEDLVAEFGSDVRAPHRLARARRPGGSGLTRVAAAVIRRLPALEEPLRRLAADAEGLLARLR
ncbi:MULTISPECIES: rhamnan synthesis F family protein [unclassified Pseudoclavibacter]|uniref:rhamnan synthesis F family protein n=1 Tax=unclassified Pseudoclavibacter TaxID=2615177 RepID=UPI0015E407BB|nr:MULTISPECIES: rhamnan synthesis F family protein [unclassified Pseudoclavibacter]